MVRTAANRKLHVQFNFMVSLLWIPSAKASKKLERSLGSSQGCGFQGQSLNLFLQLLLRAFIEAGKLDAHPHSAVTCPHHRSGLNSFGIKPEADVQCFFYRQRDHGLDIAAISTDVCGVGLHVYADAHTLRI